MRNRIPLDESRKINKHEMTTMTSVPIVHFRENRITKCMQKLLDQMQKSILVKKKNLPNSIFRRVGHFGNIFLNFIISLFIYSL